MKSVEQVGLVKFDFLGLKTLTVIEKALTPFEKRDIHIDIDSIALDDAKTYQMLSEGDTVGVFQLESGGMRDVLRGLKPDRFEDIIAVVALYRPGPMENIPTYISRKHKREAVVYMHPLLEPILGETYGIMIYQEQVQQAARDPAGYTLGGADLLRRAMGKKIKEEMDEQREILSRARLAMILMPNLPLIFLNKLPHSPAMDLINHTPLPMRWSVIKRSGLRLIIQWSLSLPLWHWMPVTRINWQCFAKIAYIKVYPFCRRILTARKSLFC